METLFSLSDAEFESACAAGRLKRSQLWTQLFQEARARRRTAMSNEQVEEDGDASSQRHFLPEVGNYDKVLSSLSNSDKIDLDTFLSLTKLVRVCPADNAANLFNALVAMEKNDEDQDGDLRLSAAVFRAFVDEWRLYLAERRLDLPSSVRFGNGESVILTQPLTRVADLGTGTLILTHHRIFLLKSRSTWQELCRLEHILEVRWRRIIVLCAARKLSCCASFQFLFPCLGLEEGAQECVVGKGTRAAAQSEQDLLAAPRDVVVGQKVAAPGGLGATRGLVRC